MVKIPMKSDVEMSVACSHDEPRYPYGTELCFRDDLVELLGIGDLQVGQTVTITAVATVSRRSESSSQRAGAAPENDKSIDLQLTEVAVQRPGGDLLTTLYGKS